MMKACKDCGISTEYKPRRVTLCKPCKATRQRAYCARTGYHKARYAKFAESERERHLVRKYGIDLQQYAAMLHKQEGRCAICGAPEAEQFKGVFHVDHCHSTGAVRGLLCRGCNHMLGVVGDDPIKLLRAIAYLKGPQIAAEVIAAYMDCRP